MAALSPPDVTLFDYLVLFILICSVVIGTLRGLVKEILSLLSWIVALVVANAYSEPLAILLPDMIPGTITRLIVAFIALFIAVRLLMALLSMAVDALVQASGLTLAGRGLGRLFGLGAGLLTRLAAGTVIWPFTREPGTCHPPRPGPGPLLAPWLLYGADPWAFSATTTRGPRLGRA